MGAECLEGDKLDRPLPAMTTTAECRGDIEAFFFPSGKNAGQCGLSSGPASVCCDFEGLWCQPFASELDVSCVLGGFHGQVCWRRLTRRCSHRFRTRC